MKRKERLAIGMILTACIIASIQAAWNIDIAISALASKNQMITIGGIVNVLDYYHTALLRLFMAISGISVLSVVLLIDNGGQP